MHRFYGDSLAQLVEHIPFKDGVVGSNPTRITTKTASTTTCGLSFFSPPQHTTPTIKSRFLFLDFGINLYICCARMGFACLISQHWMGCVLFYGPHLVRRLCGFGCESLMFNRRCCKSFYYEKTLHNCRNGAFCICCDGSRSGCSTVENAFTKPTLRRKPPTPSGAPARNCIQV